ncbi:diversity-generating retroelement protein Avd [Hyphomonas sp.]|uniref:diversity-generating retroelement protein Avd n=1 Tax=Hyphomonas sp. TaxID=87 RepID=UPI00391D13DE
MKKDANPGKVIAELSFQFLVWVTQKVEKFPRTHKFTIGDRIQGLVIDIQQGLVEATYTRDRAALLRQAQLQLEKLRFLFRLAAEIRLINADSYQHAARQIDEIGRMTGGWQKAHHAQAPQRPLSADRLLRGSETGSPESDPRQA